MSKRSEFFELVTGFAAPGFTGSEIVPRIPRRRRAMPPRPLWPNICPTLVVANALRTIMMAKGARGLRIAAAYRPKGGATNSQHKHNRALDLDLLKSDYHLANTYYIAATRLWCVMGGESGECPMGLGLYCGPNRLGGIRVHIDVGYRARTWQGHRRGFIKPWKVGGKPVPLARHLCAVHGWEPPVWEDDHS